MNYPSLETVPHEWKPGDVILDLYEVQFVTEGHRENQIEKPFHEGGFGRVYKVWHQSWQRDLAVKCPKPIVSLSQDARSAFQCECETWINLRLHPNVTACHYVRDLGGSPRVFSEYADAGTLADWISSGRLYDGDDSTIVNRILDLSIQFARGLHHAHESGVIHQDVKSLNALMWEDGALKVTDFGIGGTRFSTIEEKIIEPNQTLIVTAGSMTPSHCSPEQRAGKKLDRRTDIWSWAVCVLEMFNGGVTWLSGAAADKALEAYLEYGSATDHIPMIPDAMIPLLRKCLSIDPEKRPKTLAVCATAIKEAYEELNRIDYARLEPIAVTDSPESLNNRAISLIDLGRNEEAKSVFEQATKKYPSSRSIVYNYNLFKWRMKLIAVNDFLKCLDGSVTSSNNDFDTENNLINFELGFFQEVLQSVHAKSSISKNFKSLAKQMNVQNDENNTNLILFLDQFGKINDMHFSWLEDIIYFVSDKTYLFNLKDQTSQEVSNLGNKIKLMKVLRKRRGLVAIDSFSKLIISNSNNQFENVFIDGIGGAMEIFETPNPRYLLAKIGYSHPTAIFLPAHTKIQTIDLDAGIITGDVLDSCCGVDISSVSDEGNLIVASMPTGPSGYSALDILVWDGNDGRTLVRFQYAPAVNTFSSVIDYKTMRMFCSIAEEPGISVIDLNLGVEVAVIGKELGQVSKLEIAKHEELLFVISSIYLDGNRLDQVSIYNIKSYNLVAILMRGDHLGSIYFYRWSAFPSKGVVAACEIATGKVTLFRCFMFNRSPYLYLEGKSYLESREISNKYFKLISAAEEHWKKKDSEKALHELRLARSIPGYSQEQQGKLLWREIGSFHPKIGVRWVNQINAYQPEGDLTHGSFYGRGILDSSGDKVLLVHDGFRPGDKAISTQRILLWNAISNKTDVLLGCVDEYPESEIFSLCVTGKNYLAFQGHIRNQFDIFSKSPEISVFELSGCKRDWSNESREIAMSHDGVWVAVTNNFPKNDSGPSVLIWEASSKQPTKLNLNSSVKLIYKICSCIYQEMPALVISCDIGLHIYSINNQFKQFQLTGAREKKYILSASTCGKFIACDDHNSSAIQVFDIENEGKLIFCIKFGPTVKSICLTKNAEIIMVLSDNILQFCSVLYGTIVYEMPVHTDYCSKISNSTGDENTFCITGLRSISLYEIDWNY
jgi:serine/threonine protein kinase